MTAELTPPPTTSWRSAARTALDPAFQPFRVARDIGQVSIKALVNVPASFAHRAYIVKLISDVAVGSGAMIVGAGAVIVVVFMTAVIGVQVGLEGYEGLELIGAEDLIGFLSAFANVREITPLAAGITSALSLTRHNLGTCCCCSRRVATFYAIEIVKHRGGSVTAAHVSVQ